MKQTILTLLILFFIFSSNGQIFRKSDLYNDPGVSKIKRKGFNGSSGKGYWTLDKLDGFGRTIERKSFKHRRLLTRTRYTYNSDNDVTLEINDNDINNPHRSDTFRYEYEYSNGKIIFQRQKARRGDSTIYRLIENKGDSIFTYSDSQYYYLPDKKINIQSGHTIRLTYQNNLVTKREYIEEGKSLGVVKYEYYENRKIKRRIYERPPKSEFGIKGIYVGGPGADDQSYRYSYNKKGRIKDLYTIIDDKTYKLVTYRYK